MGCGKTGKRKERHRNVAFKAGDGVLKMMVGKGWEKSV